MSHRKNPIPTPVRPQAGPDAASASLSPPGRGRGQALLFAGLVQTHQNFVVPILACPHTGDGRPPARLPSRRRTRAQTNSALPCGGMHQHFAPAFLQPEPAPLQNGGLSSFFQRLAHRFSANALYYLAFDQPVGQQFQRPTGPAFRRFSAGQGNQSLPRTGYGWASP